MNKEIWKDIPNYENIYKASSNGKIKRVDKNKILKEGTTYGYKSVQLCKNNIAKTFRVHRLVMLAFVKNPKNKAYINHKNGIRDDNRLKNLEWCTPEENCHHAYINNKMQWKNRLNPIKVLKAREMYKTGKFSQAALAKKFGVSQPTMNFCLRRITWKSI